jgi:sugar O-acyltransferase (sialic acid O-acetyltransferase NeuD family)
MVVSDKRGLKMKNKKLAIIGMGETAHLAYEYFTHDSEYEIVGFCVDKAYLKEDRFLNLPVIAFEEIKNIYPPTEYYAFAALAGGRLNRDRANMYLKAKEKGYKMASYISSKAFVWHNVEIGENCFILEDNTLQPFTKIGNNVIMWSGNHLGHRSVINDNCFITSHCVISGFCEIGEYSYLGVNCAVADMVKIARDNFIAMGAAVTRSTEENKMYAGVPAKDMRRNCKQHFKVVE